MTTPLAACFPGQGSQSVGMLDGLAAAFPLVRDTFAEASQALGRDLWTLVSDGPKETLDQTENTQPAMLVAGVAAWRVWRAQGGPDATIMAGHSLGEYAALVAADALSLADGVRLAAARARFMQAAVPAGQGAMAAVLGLTDAQVIALCAGQAQGAVLEAVNFNGPGQVVIAGESAAVARATTAAKAAGAKRALLLPVSVPSHCALMRPAAIDLAEALSALDLRVPRVPVLHNVDVTAADSVAALTTRLCRQLYQPVRWVETVQAMAAGGVRLAIEFGPGKVLTGLNKRIDKTMITLPVCDPETLDQALAAALETTAHAQR
ncbi:ACP S-malonyltransferase [Candidatus Thiodictyon syntrophicum]|uniref:Malonyl CoA-acyl carrier protein transacylase n=1 Tax=Candidatus Thiodictyon syntrophicum TaxID=1166950 RepID=A0A2K8U9V1_9GAMM|nr:ACP S-malonyltransferase [Candidatus Thiodictyon syntrophicum]AUB82317.1 [acyl-carrier-protein] S-malonyltransferase [Candidatus Thiodictyon syntrophicum]